MKWKVKPEPPTPNYMDDRIIIKFAWFPTRTENDEMVWLERYTAKQSYFGYRLGWETLQIWARSK